MRPIPHHGCRPRSAVPDAHQRARMSRPEPSKVLTNPPMHLEPRLARREQHGTKPEGGEAARRAGPAGLCLSDTHPPDQLCCIAPAPANCRSYDFEKSAYCHAAATFAFRAPLEAETGHLSVIRLSPQDAYSIGGGGADDGRIQRQNRHRMSRVPAHSRWSMGDCGCTWLGLW